MVPYGKATAEKTQATQTLESTFTSCPSLQHPIGYFLQLGPISLQRAGNHLPQQTRPQPQPQLNPPPNSPSTHALYTTTNEATMTHSRNSSFSTMSSIRTPSRTSSVYSGPDPFLEFDSTYSIYESELEGYTTNEESDDGKFEQVDYEDGRELGVMNMGKRLGRRERIRKWIRKVLRYSQA